MVDEDPLPDPKPNVEYHFIDEYVDEKPDILELFERRDKIARGFGTKQKPLNKEIIKEIHNSHKRPELKEFFIPYDLDIENDKDLIGPPIPKDFNAKEEEEDYSNPPNRASIEAQISKKKENHVKLKPMPDNYEDSNDSMNSDEEDDDDEQATPANRIPISHLVELNHSQDRAVNSLDIDRSGIRMVSGCLDGTVKIWDFNNLTRKPDAFKTLEACDGYPVLSVSWGPSGGFFLACTGDCQAKVYDRDGNFEIGCLKGDNYLHDIGNTKGHTYPLTDGKFHPKEKSLFITSSRDSTIREWDIFSKPMGIDGEIMQSTILKAKTFKNHKICINSCAYSNEGRIIVGGVNDGSIQFWDRIGSAWRPSIYIPDAHEKNSEVTAVKFFSDDVRLLSRGSDSTMKMWDLRRHNKPLYSWENLPSFSVNTGLTLSPDETIAVTGTSVKKGHEYSKLQFFSTYNYSEITRIPVCKNSITSMLWNDKLNQLAVSATDGVVRMFFDPTISKNGIVNSIYKKAKRREIDDFDYMKPIITPRILPFIEEVNFDSKTYREKINPDPAPQHKADLPEQGPGSKLARNPSVTQNIMNVMHRRLYDEGDPRNVLLSFREKNGKVGEWVEGAYHKTQPKPVFNTNQPKEIEVIYSEQSDKKKCHACGLRFCSCNKTMFTQPIPKITKQKYKDF